MVRRGRRRARPRRTFRRPAMRKAFNGGTVRGKLHPPTACASPWNNYVLTTTWKTVEAGLQCVSSKDVERLLRTEIGLKADQAIDLRVSRVDAWVPPAFVNSDRNYIVFSPCDWTDKEACVNRAALNWYEAWGTAVQPAHLHYIWQKSIANQVLKDNADITLFQLDISLKDLSYLFKIHVQWRPSTPDPRPVVKGILQSVRHREPAPPGVDYDFVQVYDAVGSHQMSY